MGAFRKISAAKIKKYLREESEKAKKEKKREEVWGKLKYFSESVVDQVMAIADILDEDYKTVIDFKHQGAQNIYITLEVDGKQFCWYGRYAPSKDALISAKIFQGNPNNIYGYFSKPPRLAGTKQCFDPKKASRWIYKTLGHKKGNHCV